MSNKDRWISPDPAYLCPLIPVPAPCQPAVVPPCGWRRFHFPQGVAAQHSRSRQATNPLETGWRRCWGSILPWAPRQAPSLSRALRSTSGTTPGGFTHGKSVLKPSSCAASHHAPNHYPHNLHRPIPVQNRDMCPRGVKMPGASPQSHDASGWGNSKMGTPSRWHHERAPHLSQFSNPPPSPTTQRVDNRPPLSTREDFLLKR